LNLAKDDSSGSSGWSEHRRGKRFALYVPVHVNWQEPNGQEVTEAASVAEANAHGGVLQMSRYPAVACHMRLTNALSGQTAEARTVAIRRSEAGTIVAIAVELLSPDEGFWGLNFRLKKSSSELRELELALTSGDTDARVLKEFRDAVDYARKTAWAVQEWQERQLKSRDTSTVLPLLTSERIRRAAQLCRNIAADVESHDVAADAIGIRELLDAIAHLSERLRLPPD
jgi:hypothetical protein